MEPVAVVDQDDGSQVHDEAGYPDDDPTLTEDLRLLVSQAKAFAQAEIAFQKSRAAYAAAESRTILVLFIAAAVLVFFAVMALVVGSVIALGPLLGPWGAMGAVTALLLVIAVLCVLRARTGIQRLMAAVSGREEMG
ncbi:hypothetical protein WSK_1174 [Novosphingobium sp. Rr 2-17]|nr:hypothetical protein WSK_1174 [Novosphingobium sp. Rr 2-17]